MTIHENDKMLARYLKSVLGGVPAVSKYWDDDRRRNIDIFSVNDRPVSGVSTLSTLGLSGFDIGLVSGGAQLGVELVFPLAKAFESAANIVASIAFGVVNSEYFPKPDAIIPRIVELYYPKTNLPHILLTAPFLWNLETQEFEKKKVAWLQMVPISDAERNFALRESVGALEDAFEAKQIDVFTLSRPSVF
jgi:hypothetical protein